MLMNWEESLFLSNLEINFGICEKDPIEIFVDGSTIILKKYEPNCIFCGSTKKLVTYNGKLICPKCSEKIHRMHESV